VPVHERWPYCDGGTQQSIAVPLGQKRTEAFALQDMVGGGPSDGLKYGANNQRDFACSQGGKTTYPYGDQFADGVCTSADPGVVTKPVGQGDCHGQSPPFSQIERLAGGVHEWLDACLEAAPHNCRVGSAEWMPPASADCTNDGSVAASEHLEGVGFRCCAD